LPWPAGGATSEQFVDADLPADELERVIGIERDSFFNNVAVSRKSSVVKLPSPANESRNDPNIQQDVLWSAALDAVFRDNLQVDPTIKWQYFGSKSGMFRTFPGKRWSVPASANTTELMRSGPTNTYDPRFRPWFVASATGPKDLLILLDTSGSMALGAGDQTRLAVAVNAVKLVINSLSAADFFNVILFNDNVRTVSCFNSTLARATSINKRTILETLDAIEPSGGTNFNPAFELAFRMLSSSDASTASSGCQATILFITDGISGDPRPLIRAEQAKRAGNRVRIFSYSISSEADRRMAYDIARENGGAFLTVRDAGRSNRLPRFVSRYYDHFGDGFPAWSAPYIDANGLGLMVTRAVPVFVPSTNPAAVGGSELLGVVGIDVTMREIEQIILNEVASEDSYAFLMNRDGEALVHPRFKVHSTPVFPDITQLETTDSDVAEREAFNQNVRLPIVNGLDGSYRLVMPRLYSKGDQSTEGVRKEYRNVTYYFATIPNTEFILCLALLDSFIKPRDIAHIPLPRWKNEVVAQRRADGEQQTDWQPSLFHALFSPSALKDYGARAGFVDLKMDPANPVHPNVPVAPSHAMFALAPTLYCDAEAYLQKPCARDISERIISLVNDNDDPLPLCRNKGLVDPIVRTQVRATEHFTSLWANVTRNPAYRHIVWQYFGSREGLLRLYPGFQLDNKNYNPARRFWFQRALAFPRSHSLSVPYIDAFGAGDVITLAMPVFEGDPDCIDRRGKSKRDVEQVTTTTTTTGATTPATTTAATPTTVTSTLTTTTVAPTTSTTPAATTTTTTTTTTATPTTTTTEAPTTTAAPVIIEDDGVCTRTTNEVLGVMGLDFKYRTLYDMFRNTTRECVTQLGERVPCETELNGTIVPGAPMCESECTLSGTSRCRLTCFVIDAAGQLVFHPTFYEAPDAGQFADTFMSRLLAPLTEALTKIKPKPFLRRSSDFLDWTAECAVPSKASGDSRRSPQSDASRATNPLEWLSGRRRQSEWTSEQCVPPTPAPTPEAGGAASGYGSGATGPMEDCVQSVNVYEVDPTSIPADTGVLRGSVFHRCMLGEFYVSRIGAESNLYLIVVDNFEQLNDTACVYNEIRPDRTRSSADRCREALVRRQPLCAQSVEVATASRCACSDPSVPCNENTAKVLDCNGNGDCDNGRCLCDVEFATNPFCANGEQIRASFALLVGVTVLVQLLRAST
jgi:hypothetical protein